MDMSKYKPLFLSETNEHLDSLESDLMVLEQQPADRERIDEVFRHLHSVKSMSASMGYDPISHIAHMLEDLVALHRDEHLPFAKDEIDLLLSGLDELRSRMVAARDESPMMEVPDEFVSATKQLVRKLRECPEQETVAPDESQSEKSPHKVDTTLSMYKLRVSIDPECSLPAVRAFVAYKRFSQVGKVVESEPDQKSLKAGILPEKVLCLTLSTASSQDDLQRLAETLVDIKSVEIGHEHASKPVDPSAALEGKILSKDGQAVAEVDANRESTKVGFTQDQTVRVRTEILDFFVDSVGELITLRSFFEELADRSDTPAFRDGVRRMSKVVRKLQDRVMEVRMVPVSVLTDRLPRVCRDLARSRGKQVQFVVEGGSVELDRALIETLNNPLLHIIRNAIEHGIESPTQREQASKDAQATIRLLVERQQDRVLIEISDDGRGIDPNRVYQKAIQAGRVSLDDKLTDEQKLDLIFLPGLSTHKSVNEIAGRGVGLDVVRDTIEALGGRVVVDSVIGRGTAFCLDLPLTLAILQTLLLESAGFLMALPASRVLRAISVQPSQVTHREKGAFVVLGGKQYPFEKLSKLLSAHQNAGDERESSEVVLVGKHDNPELALGVDRITGHREAVLKSVGRIIREVGPYNASTILGDGRPVLILDVDALLERARSIRAG